AWSQLEEGHYSFLEPPSPAGTRPPSEVVLDREAEFARPPAHFRSGAAQRGCQPGTRWRIPVPAAEPLGVSRIDLVEQVIGKGGERDGRIRHLQLDARVEQAIRGQRIRGIGARAGMRLLFADIGI